MYNWLAAFLLTEAIEVPIYSMALGGWPWTARLALASGASLLTHPLLWMYVGAVDPDCYWQAVVAAETWAVLTEGVYLAALQTRCALPWSLLANAASFAFGLIVQWSGVSL
jgi:hypothetical protein